MKQASGPNLPTRRKAPEAGVTTRLSLQKGDHKFKSNSQMEHTKKGGKNREYSLMCPLKIIKKKNCLSNPANQKMNQNKEL